MLDLQFLCEHSDQVEENCRNRGVRVDVGAIVELAKKRSQLIVEGDKYRHEQKETSAQIPKTADAATKTGSDRAGQGAAAVSSARTRRPSKRWRPSCRDRAMEVPNMTHPEAPVGGGRRCQPGREDVGRNPQVRFPAASTMSPSWSSSTWSISKPEPASPGTAFISSKTRPSCWRWPSSSSPWRDCGPRDSLCSQRPTWHGTTCFRESDFSPADRKPRFIQSKTAT